MFALDLCRARLRYRLKLVSPLHVGGGGEEKLVRGQGEGKGREARDYGLRPPGSQKDAEVTLPIHQVDPADGRVRFLVPGSSLRGVLRAHLTQRFEQALKGAGRQTQERFLYDQESLEGKDGSWTDPVGERSSGQIMVRMTFGSTARRGQLAIGSARLTGPATTQVRYSGLHGPTRPGGRQRDGALRLLVQNRLDRATQASAARGLRTLATLEEGQELEGEMWLRNFACWQLGLLALARGAAARGELRLGGKTSVGLGRVELRFVRLDLGWHRRVMPDGGEGCFGIGEALQRMGMLAGEGDRRRGTLGLRQLGTQAGSVEAQLFSLDAQDRINVRSGDPRFHVQQDDSLIGRCYHHVHTDDAQLVDEVLAAGASRVRQMVLDTTAERG